MVVARATHPVRERVTDICLRINSPVSWMAMQGALADGGPKAQLLRHVNQLQLGNKFLCHVNRLRAGFS